MEIFVLLIIAGGVYWLYKTRKVSPAQQRDWVRKFSVYYATEGLCLHGATLGDIPERLVGLMERQVARDTQQAFLAGLENFLRDHCGRTLQPGDYQLALADIRNLLATQNRLANNYVAMVPLVRAMHKEETGEDITEAELAAICREIINRVKTDETAAFKMVGQIARFNLEAMFKDMFGMPYNEYRQANHPKATPATAPAGVTA